MTLSKLLALGMALSLPTWAFAAAAPEACQQTGELANGHTCGHGEFGPFDSRVAQPYPLEQFVLLPDVDPTHTLYTVLLSGASASNQWTVSYQPIVAGSYAFYMKFPGKTGTDEAPFALELHDGFGDTIPLRFEHGFPSCNEYLSWIKVFDLDPVEYRLIIGGEEGESVQIAIEHLDAFAGSELFVDADGDGHGDPGARLESWCAAAAGYVLLEAADDCDDDDETAHPGNVEICNDKDDDCNGVVDDTPVGCVDAGTVPTPSGEPLPEMREAGGAPGELPAKDSGAIVLPAADAGAGASPSPDAELPRPSADSGTGSEPSGVGPVPDARAPAPTRDASEGRDAPISQQRAHADCSCSTVRSMPMDVEAVSLSLMAGIALLRRRRASPSQSRLG